MKIDVQAGIGAQHCHDITYNEKKDVHVVFVLSNSSLQQIQIIIISLY